ncbi:hypothetical protein [Salmonella phage vB_SalS_TU03]|nr:hypothetical protein [Salmonella phage vB_SalS_TU03]
MAWGFSGLLTSRCRGGGAAPGVLLPEPPEARNSSLGFY